MIDLDDSALFIGSGTRRDCYRHPGDPALCIKVSPPGEEKQQRRECRYYRGLARRGASLEHLARLHGTVETSKGTGYVYDLVRDHDGTIATPLRVYLNEEYPSRDELIRLVRDLKAYYIRERIMFYDMNGDNILCSRRADGSLHLVTIDGIGEVTATGFLNVFRSHFLRTFHRRWVRVVRRFNKRHPWMADYTY